MVVVVDDRLLFGVLVEQLLRCIGCQQKIIMNKRHRFARLRRENGQCDRLRIKISVPDFNALIATHKLVPAGRLLIENPAKTNAKKDKKAWNVGQLARRPRSIPVVINLDSKLSLVLDRHRRITAINDHFGAGDEGTRIAGQQ